jgi:glycosyltransferase involved in cell wall biosynthesis
MNKIEKNILISIIIPTHNRGYIIKECIDSILNQTYKNFELIIVDDHSDDNTIEILNNIKDSRLKIFKSEEKNGAQTARNIGIKNALGDWICFNDSDDFWLENKLEIHIKYLKQMHYNKNIVFYTDCYKYDKSNNKKTRHELHHIYLYSSYKSLLTGQGPMFQGLFLHKSLIINNGLLDENVLSYQEWDTSLILARNHAKFFHIKKPLFIYNLHSGTTISKDIIRGFNGYQYILNKYKNEIIKYAGENIWNEHLYSQLNRMYEIISLNNNISDNPILNNNIKIFLDDVKTYFNGNRNIIIRMIKKIKFFKNSLIRKNIKSQKDYS